MKLLFSADFSSETATWVYESTPGESWYQIKFYDWKECTGELNGTDKYGVVVEYLSMHYVTLKDMASAIECCGWIDAENVTPKHVVESLFAYGKGDTETQFWGNNKRELLQLARAHVRRNVEG